MNELDLFAAIGNTDDRYLDFTPPAPPANSCRFILRISFMFSPLPIRRAIPSSAA